MALLNTGFISDSGYIGRAHSSQQSFSISPGGWLNVIKIVCWDVTLVMKRTLGLPFFLNTLLLHSTCLLIFWVVVHNKLWPMAPRSYDGIAIFFQPVSKPQGDTFQWVHENFTVSMVQQVRAPTLPEEPRMNSQVFPWFPDTLCDKVSPRVCNGP